MGSAITGGSVAGGGVGGGSSTLETLFASNPSVAQNAVATGEYLKFEHVHGSMTVTGGNTIPLESNSVYRLEANFRFNDTIQASIDYKWEVGGTEVGGAGTLLSSGNASNSSDGSRAVYELTTTAAVNAKIKFTFVGGTPDIILGFTSVIVTRLDNIGGGGTVNITTGTEYLTGRVIDGDAEYGKRITLTNKPNAGTSTNAHGITGINEHVSIEAHFTDASNNASTIASNNTGGSDDEFIYWDGTNISWVSNVNRTTVTKAFSTVTYTKT